MGKVYLHRAGLPDIELGRVEEDGTVFRKAAGPDDRVGRVDLENGKVFASRLGPDDYYGRIDLKNGRVTVHKAGKSDEYVGRVNADGRMDLHIALSPDAYMGKIKPPLTLAHAGAAFLLLVLPAAKGEEE